MADRLGQQLGNYRLMRVLGRGGFAEVYLGEHVELGTQAAIKVLHAQLTSKDLERFNAEASTIARLSHPHIVRLLEFATDEGTPFLVLDYAPGGTLRERHSRGTPLPVETILPYVQQACDALQYAHDKKLIHRDVKPENLLLAADRRVLLSDFGIATVAQSSHSQSTQEALGTITYMAPEQIQGKPRPASDLYALGIIVYEWLAGDPPFSGSFGEIATQHLFTPPQPLRERVPEISEAVEYVVLTALAKDPHQRFASARAFATALEEAAWGNSSLLFAPTQITPPTLANAPTLPGALHHPSSDITRRASNPPVTSRTAPELPPTFSVPPVLAATASQPTGPLGAKPPRNLFKNVLIAVLALLLIGTSGVALALSHPSLFGGSGASPGGNNSGTNSSNSSSSSAIANGSSTPTPNNRASTPGATDTPTPTDTPSPTPTDTPTPVPPTPTPPPAPSGPVILGNVTNMDGYCQAIGDTSSALAGSTAYDWRCVTPGGQQVSVDMTAVCQWQYNDSNAVARMLNYSDPYSWQCFTNASLLGPLSNMNGYCQSIGDSSASLDGSTPYDWNCVTPGGQHVSFSFTDACRWQYNDPQALDRILDYYDPNTWQCWG